MSKLKYLKFIIPSLKAHSKAQTIFGIWKPFKKMKNGFYFTWKAYFILKIFKFLSWVFGHVGKCLY